MNQLHLDIISLFKGKPMSGRTEYILQTEISIICHVNRTTSQHLFIYCMDQIYPNIVSVQ